MLTLYSTRAFDRLLNDVWNNGWDMYTPAHTSPLKVKDGIASVSYEVPGIPKDKLSVSWKEDILSITGKHGGRSVSYRVSMPNIDTTSIKAECVDGILTITANIRKEDDGVINVQIT